MEPVSKGSRSMPEGVKRGFKGSQNPPYQALGGPRTLEPGYLVLSNSYPGCPGRASGYRVRIAEDTVTGGRMSSVLGTLPGGNQGH